jgi:hypothetical protein
VRKFASRACNFKNVTTVWHHNWAFKLMSFLSEIRGFDFVKLDKPPETVIKQHLPKDVTLKKVGEENADSNAEVCDWVKHAQTIEAKQLNVPKKVSPHLVRRVHV